MSIFLTAVIKARPAYIGEVSAVLQNLVSRARKEAACIRYDLHQELNGGNVFVFYEQWSDQRGLDAHNSQPYILEFGRFIADKTEEPMQVYLMNKL